MLREEVRVFVFCLPDKRAFSLNRDLQSFVRHGLRGSCCPPSSCHAPLENEFRQLRASSANVPGHTNPGPVRTEALGRAGHLRRRLDPPRGLAGGQAENAGSGIVHRLVWTYGRKCLDCVEAKLQNRAHGGRPVL